MMMIIIFIACSLTNVILNTLKTLIMINANRNASIIINAICYGFYTLVVKQLAEVDYATAVIVTTLANVVGVWISYKILDMFKKDKVWRITTTFKNKEDFTKCKELLEKYQIGFVENANANCIDIYSYSRKDSAIIKEVLQQYKHKYFVQEMGRKL